jgi:hypothetical protein
MFPDRVLWQICASFLWQHRLHGRDPVLSIRFRARQTKLAFITTEGDNVAMLTIGAQVDGVPLGRISTAEHLLHDRVGGRIPGMGLLKVLPSVDKDLLEAVILRPTVWCHARECK